MSRYAAAKSCLGGARPPSYVKTDVQQSDPWIGPMQATGGSRATPIAHYGRVELRGLILSSLEAQMARRTSIHCLGALLPATVRFRHFDCRASGSTIKETSDDRGT